MQCGYYIAEKTNCGPKEAAGVICNKGRGRNIGYKEKSEEESEIDLNQIAYTEKGEEENRIDLNQITNAEKNEEENEIDLNLNINMGGKELKKEIRIPLLPTAGKDESPNKCVKKCSKVGDTEECNPTNLPMPDE